MFIMVDWDIYLTRAVYIMLIRVESKFEDGHISCVCAQQVVVCQDGRRKY